MSFYCRESCGTCGFRSCKLIVVTFIVLFYVILNYISLLQYTSKL
jgi:hypothetical protein